MSKVYARKTAQVTATGKAVYSVAFADEMDITTHEVAFIEDLACGDDTWANVLQDNADIVIVNEQGQIDIDRVVFAQRLAAAAKARDEAGEWSEEDDYVDE